MTTPHDESAPGHAPPPEEVVRFVYPRVDAAGLLRPARALLDAAPRELAESFEQAVRAAGLSS